MSRLNVIFVSALLNEAGQDLPSLLASAARLNATGSLRSMLLFSAGSVMQAIDGESEETRREVQRLFQSRHYVNSIVLNEEKVESPSLHCSSLGAHRLAPALIEELPPGLAFFELCESAVVQRVRNGIARNLLKQFAADYS